MGGKWRDVLNSVGLLVLRLGIGGYMASHGWGKVQMIRTGATDMWHDPIGVGKMPSLYMATFGEFVCAILVMIGLATRPAALAVVVTMSVAAFVVHRNDPWSMETAAKAFFAGKTQFPVSKEMALLYLVPFLALVFTGPGRVSLDALLLGRRGRGAASA